RKSAFVNYFFFENALIWIAGLFLRPISALLLRQLLMQHYSIAALPSSYIAVKAVMWFTMTILAVF
ncbi:cell division protein FtsX, partial [Pseudoalteromonas sp. S1610]